MIIDLCWFGKIEKSFSGLAGKDSHWVWIINEINLWTRSCFPHLRTHIRSYTQECRVRLSFFVQVVAQLNVVTRFDEKRMEIPNNTRLSDIHDNLFMIAGSQRLSSHSDCLQVSKPERSVNAWNIPIHSLCRLNGIERTSSWINNQFKRQWRLEFFNQRRITARKSFLKEFSLVSSSYSQSKPAPKLSLENLI